MRIALCFVIALAFAPVACAATPSDEQPDALFSVRGDRENERLLLEATKLHTSLLQDIQLYTESNEPRSLARLKPLKISESHVNVLRLNRLATQLVFRGETCGSDLERRCEDMRRVVRETVNRYLELPGKQQQIARSYQTARKEAGNASRKLPKIESLADEGKWQEAYTELNELLDFVESRAVWYDDKEALALIQPFQRTKFKVTNGFNEQAKKKGEEAVQILRREADPQLAELISAVQAVGSGKSTELMPPGVEGLRSFLERWRDSQLRAIRCHGLDWASMGKTGRSPPEELSELREQWETFINEVRPATLSWLRSEVDRADAADARELYLELLPVLTEIAVGVDNQVFAAALADPLAELAAKDPAFSEEIAAYRLATDEMLRWRERCAASKRSTIETETESLDATFLAAARTSGAEPGLIRSNARSDDDIRLMAPAPDSVKRLAENMIGKRVYIGALSGLPISHPMATTRYSGRCFGTINLPSEVQSRWQTLREDLLVSDELPPLTLRASIALERAQRGNFLEGECEIVHVALEPLTYRMGTLKESAQRIFSLDTLPLDEVKDNALDQVLVRCELRPIWLMQQNYLLVFSSEPAADEEQKP